MQVGRRSVAVGDDGVAAIDGAVVHQVEEALGLTFLNHVATVRIGTADLRVFGLGRRFGQLRFQGLFTLSFAIAFDGIFQTVQLGGHLLLRLFKIVPVLVGVRFEVRAARVKHFTTNQVIALRLKRDLIEDFLIDATVLEPPPAVLAQGGGIRNLVSQVEAQEPAIRHVNLYLPPQLPLTMNAEQIAQKQHLEQHHRILCQPTVVLAVQVLNPVTDKFKIDVLINFAQKVVVGDQRFETDHLEFVLWRGRLFEHGVASEKSMSQLQQTPAVMARVCQQSGDAFSAPFSIRTEPSSPVE